MLKVCLTSLGSYIWQFDSLLCLIFGYSPDRVDILCEWSLSGSGDLGEAIPGEVGRPLEAMEAECTWRELSARLMAMGDVELYLV